MLWFFFYWRGRRSTIRKKLDVEKKVRCVYLSTNSRGDGACCFQANLWCFFSQAGHPDLPANMHLPLPVAVAGLSLVAFVSLMLLYIWRSHRGLFSCLLKWHFASCGFCAVVERVKVHLEGQLTATVCFCFFNWVSVTTERIRRTEGKAKASSKVIIQADPDSLHPRNYVRSVKTSTLWPPRSHTIHPDVLATYFTQNGKF